MGKATITQSLGAGLHRIKLMMNVSSIEAEVDILQEGNTGYLELLLSAISTERALRDGVHAARLGMDSVIQQWKEAVISETQQHPPDLPLDDPGETVESEQRANLLVALNSQRASAVTRDSALDSATNLVLSVLAATRRTTDINSSPENRASSAGYAFDADHGVEMVLQFGAMDAETAVERMMRIARYAGVIQGAEWTECGVGYLYAPRNPYSYLWGAIFSVPGVMTEVIRPADDPAKETANTQGDELEKIELPSVETFQPEKLGEVSAAYGVAIQMHRAAADELARLRSEQQAREKRLARLKGILAASEEEIWAWACIDVDLPVGAVVDIAEVPGWYRDNPIQRIAVVDGASITYDERPINIIPVTESGQLTPAEGISDAMIFFNIAMEPGHLKWAPKWRYGVVISVDENGAVCDVELDPIEARTISGLGSDMSLLDRSIARDVPILYQCENVVEVGDVVLIEYRDQDRERPQVIGFRREPKDCSGRVSWG